MSTLGYFGTSENHYDSSVHHFSAAKDSVSSFANSLWSSVSNLDAQTVKNTAAASVASWHSYEYIAGKIISTNAATHLASCFAGGSELTLAAKMTGCAASALVTNPVTCMAALMATTILFANYEHITPIVKQTANLSWEVAKTAYYATAAVAEITVASILYADECLTELLDVDCVGDLIDEFDAAPAAA
mgnify:CR=1 FL=1